MDCDSWNFKSNIIDKCNGIHGVKYCIFLDFHFNFPSKWCNMDI